MAGTQPNYPDFRLAYDRDGSIVIGRNLSGPSTHTFTTGEKQALNRESEGSPLTLTGGDGSWVAVVFPTPMTLTDYFLDLNGTTTATAIEKSLDTTTGVDGTWTGISLAGPGVWSTAGVDANHWRSAISGDLAGGHVNVKGFRVKLAGNSGSPSIANLHIFAHPTSATGSRLQFLEYGGTPATPVLFDWGTIGRGETAEIDFYIKNTSPTLTAHSVQVYMEDSTAASPTLSSWHDRSDDGTTFGAYANVGDIGPGAVSGHYVTLRRTVPSTAALGLWALRLVAEAASWS
jgi:hypothetical protein